jgi:predicted dithiol-disulfide oxidoreductase (DUF899 family)
MTDTDILSSHKIVSREEWLVARKALLMGEKEHKRPSPRQA